MSLSPNEQRTHVCDDSRLHTPSHCSLQLYKPGRFQELIVIVFVVVVVVVVVVG